MAGSTTPGQRLARRSLIALLGVAVIALGIFAAGRVGTLFPGSAAAATTSPAPPSGSEAAPTAPQSTPTAAPPTPRPTPVPTPVTVPAPLTGLPVSEAAAQHHPIAVMIDDSIDARPQGGFNAASVVWHAPAEGGVPRYMLIFQDTVPTTVGPIRSARQYFIEWASEWDSMYVHHGGSPQAKETLAAKGNGSWVYNADGFRWEGRFVFRVQDRFAPHNVMTDGDHLRKLAARMGAVDRPIEPVWQFGADASRDRRPNGGSIRVVYPYETIGYRYDAATNSYLRFICQGVCSDKSAFRKRQVDVADGQPVAPKNVVILRMGFGPLNDGHPEKHRQEAQDVGKGQAWIASNGRTIKGEWRKASPTAPTLLFDQDGNPVTLAPGQTFVQVLALNYDYEIKDGEAPVWIPPTHRDE